MMSCPLLRHLYQFAAGTEGCEGKRVLQIDRRVRVSPVKYNQKGAKQAFAANVPATLPCFALHRADSACIVVLRSVLFTLSLRMFTASKVQQTLDEDVSQSTAQFALMSYNERRFSHASKALPVWCTEAGVCACRMKPYKQ